MTRLDYETNVLEQALDPLTQCLTPEAARYLVGLRASSAAQERMDELADKCGQGELSSEERAEYEGCVSAANLLAILQRKARGILAGEATA
jgi:hypothetical protein